MKLADFFLVAVVDDRLYFMGGDYHFDGDAAGQTSSSDKLYYFDLGGSANIEAESIISSSSLNQISVPFDTTETLENQTHSQGGALFYTLDSFYVFSGLGEGSTTENNILAQYNTSSNQWSSHNVSGGNFNKLNRLFPGEASVPSTGLSFFSGGGNSGTTRPGGRPMGMAFTYQVLDNQRIYVYDIASASWYIVWAQGDEIPGRRAEQCSVMSAAPDYSSFNIAMYGGWNLYESEAYSETWVLSVPSFRWVKINNSNYTGSNTEALSGNNIGRHQHHCAVYNDSQMIVLGGIVNENGTDSTHNCDSQRPPLRILNLATMTWQKSFDASAEYTVPEDVYKVIGGE
ncbi:putative kelch repeat protein [Neofusicoccum parvum UCRNP2]|uniref:Putative kelch repeat protein n=1 Tax=Botryosphaeria parva (strain UCR-NP2) TaxID=1287680 RepID=R1GMH3_BOTPV|nr:putative kelch repeat protein [Neofusicoccum parvum UCRNP2]